MNGLDSGCGDGDCGSTHAAGAKGLQTTLTKYLDILLSPISSFVMVHFEADSMQGLSKDRVKLLYRQYF